MEARTRIGATSRVERRWSVSLSIPPGRTGRRMKLLKLERLALANALAVCTLAPRRR